MKHFYKSAFILVSLVCLLCIGNVYYHLQSQFTTIDEPKASTTAGENAAVSDSSLPGIQQVIVQREYRVSYDSQAKKFQSPNRRQNLRAFYAPGSLTLRKRIDSTNSDFELKLLNKGVFADGKLLYSVSDNAALRNFENRVLIDHGPFSEEFINNEEGVRQNFIIDQAPAGTRQLEVKLATSGMEVEDLGNNQLRFAAKSGQTGPANVLNYNGLKCWDADGEILEATLVYENAHITISVDVENAAFPVTVDPLVNTVAKYADKILEIHQSSAWVGYSVSSAGDVNGDGYSDIIVGAPKYDNGQTDEGAAFVFPGSALGISLAGVILQSNQVNAQAGTSVSSAGDINKDGYSDVLVGAPYYDDGQIDEGVVFVYLGSPSGISTNPVSMLEIHQTSANLGISVAMAGDVDGDGYSDILTGAHQYDNGQTNEGAAFLYYGSANGVGGRVAALEANQAGAMMGYAVASAGDLNADGFSDVMVGARLYSNGQTYEGAVFIYKGSASGLITANPFKVESNQVDARLGHSIAPAGDVNGDGYADILLGAYLYDGTQVNEGAVFLYMGSPAFEYPAYHEVTIYGRQSEAWFGWAVAGAGDPNGDVYSDFIIGARYYDVSHNNEGAAFVYYGGRSLKDHISDDRYMRGDQPEAWCGSAVASAGDVNGDGYSDILIGSYAYDNGQNDEGVALVYHGGSIGIEFFSSAKEVLSDSVDKQRTGAIVRDAGDVNGDGFDDIIINAPGTDLTTSQGQTSVLQGREYGLRELMANPVSGKTTVNFGHAAAGAGDVNGDGYADVIMGRPNYGPGNGGEVRIYYGSAMGIDTLNEQVLTEPTTGSLFGFTVAGAGDLNGDHFADVIVGATRYKVGDEVRGAAFVYYGSASGLIETPKILISPRANSNMGAAAAGIGDVNGDHYDDMVVGAPTTNTVAPEGGAAWIYYGSATGVENAATVFKNDNTKAHFGASVARGGDINGDGFSDMVVGIPGHGLSYQGAMCVYYGSATGLSESNKTFRTGSTANGSFGISVSGAGDLDGDGYSEIIVGENSNNYPAPSAGRAFVFPGSRYGLSQYSMFEVNGESAMERLGTSVSGAGDINGDGTPDLIIGAPGYRTSGLTDVGRLFIYYGNIPFQNAPSYLPWGRLNSPRLYNANLTTPFAQTYPGQDAEPNFGLGIEVKSFLGRNKGKLVWETRGYGQPFSSMPNSGISNSTKSTGSQNAFMNLEFYAPELKVLIPKINPETRVRVRVRYDPVLALTGQVYGPWRYLPSFLTGKSVSAPPQEMASTLRTSSEVLEEETESVSIYPNPASDKLFVRFRSEQSIAGMKLLASDGKVIYNVPAAQRELDLRNLASGIYVLTIKRVDGTQTAHKVVVRK